MLDIVVLVMLCKKMAANMRNKGRSPGGFVAMLVILWLVGEVGGFIVGAAASDGEQLAAFGCALAGMAIAATFVFLIAAAVPTRAAPMSMGFPVVQQGYPGAMYPAAAYPATSGYPQQGYYPPQGGYGSPVPAQPVYPMQQGVGQRGY